MLITSMITDRIGRHDVLLPILLIITITISEKQKVLIGKKLLIAMVKYDHYNFRKTYIE